MCVEKLYEERLFLNGVNGFDGGYKGEFDSQPVHL
jgi:hypothetical protein